MSRPISVILLLIALVSCNGNKDLSNDVLIIASFNPTIDYDSLSNPHLSIDKYIEYRLGHEILIAKGTNSSDSNLVYRKFGFVDFYKEKPIVELDNLINTTIKSTELDSFYFQKESEHTFVMIFKSGNLIKRICYNEDCLPNELDSLSRVILRIADSNTLEKIPKFKVDSLMINFEVYLFKIYPPPPPPIMNDFHFVDPEIK
jgi:hypothetical protein